jgi:hypothetical protein
MAPQGRLEGAAMLGISMRGVASLLACAIATVPLDGRTVTTVHGHVTAAATGLAHPVADFALGPVPTASISGTVREAGSGAPLANVPVSVEYLDGSQWIYDNDAVSASDGTYSIEVVPGTYRACAGGMDYGRIHQCFDHKDQGALAGDRDQTPITLADGDAHAGTDFDLVRGGAISGTLHDAYAGGPLANTGATLYVFDADGEALDSAGFATDAAGHYRLDGLPDGTFYLSLYADTVFVDHWQIYPDIVCDDSTGCPPATSGDPIEIALASEAAGVDFTLNPDVVVGGRVTDAAGGAPIASARVDFYEYQSFAGYASAAHATTDAAGNYSLYLEAYFDGYYPGATAAVPYIGVVYPNVPCIANPCIGEGDVQLYQSGDRISGLDFALAHGAAAAGHVSDATTGLPLFASISLYDAAYEEIWRGVTDTNGDYETAAWTPGTFYVRASSFRPIACAFYDDVPCPPDGNPASAHPTPVAVAADEVRGGVDFNLLAEVIFADGFDSN